MTPYASTSLHSKLSFVIFTLLLIGCTSDSPDNDTPSDNISDQAEHATNDPTNNNTATTATLNTDNMDTVIARVMDIYSGRDEFVTQLLALPGFSDVPDEVSEAQTVACTGSGLANFSYQEDGNAIEFDDCVDGSKTLNGSIRTYTFTSDFIHADNFSLSGDNLLQTLSTERVRLFPGSWDVENLNYRYQSADNDTSINNASFYWSRAVNSSNAFNMASEGSFAVSAADLLNGETLSSVATGLSITIAPQQVFEQYGTLSDYPKTMSEVFYTEGTIAITAEDGSSITLNAATGDMATVSVELLLDEATQLSSLRNWTDWKTNLRTDIVGWVR